MTLTFTPRKRRMKKRIESLPTAHDCGKYGVWTRQPKKVGPLACVICGKA